MKCAIFALEAVASLAWAYCPNTTSSSWAPGALVPDTQGHSQ